MIPNQSDKAGLHILLKLACLVVILAGIHAAADIIVQLLLALFFAIVLNPLVTWFLRRGHRDDDCPDGAFRRAGGVAQ